VKRGYIAMLAVDEKYRKRKIGKFGKAPRKFLKGPLTMLALLMYSEVWSGILNYN
jgi:hypothetical protein